MDFLQHHLIPAVITVGIGFILGAFCKKWINKLSNTPVDSGIMTFVASASSISIEAISIVMALSLLGVDTNVIVGAISAMGLGISLALKENMANVAGGVQILFTKPFRIGDYIDFNGQEGNVVRIELMFSVMRTVDNQEVIIPNAQLVNSPIVNYSTEAHRRIHLVIPMSAQMDFETCKDIFMDVIEANDNILTELPRQITVDGFEKNRMLVGIYVWVDKDVYWPVRLELLEQIQKAAHKNAFQYPYTEVYTKQ